MRYRHMRCRQGFTVPLLGALLLSAVASILASGTAGSAAKETAFASTVIRMSDKPLAFIPTTVEVKVGDTVEWDNTALTIHSVTVDPSKAARPGDAGLPPGAKAFDSGFLTPGQNFRYTFKVPGTYKYFCLPHEGDRMIGEVKVR